MTASQHGFVPALPRLLIAGVAAIALTACGTNAGTGASPSGSPATPSAPITGVTPSVSPTRSAPGPTVPVTTPSHAYNSGLMIGQESAETIVAVYSDFMCPFCGQFDEANGQMLTQLVDEGKIRINYHPMSFLDRFSNGTRYSTRTANAFTAVAHAAPDQALAFNALLFENQPQEGGTPLTDEQIADLARQAGVPNSVIETFAEETWVPFVEESTSRAFAAGVPHTPSVAINGELFPGDLYTAGPLEDELQRVIGS